MTRPVRRPRSLVKVNASPVAQRYADEKIIEYSSPVGGGLIAFLVRDERLIIEPYRHDDTVRIDVPAPAALPEALTRLLDAAEAAERLTGPGTLGEAAVRDLVYRIRELTESHTDEGDDDE